MAIKVTENWSGYRLAWKSPWSADRVFVVTGTEDGEAALAAVDPDTGVAVQQRGALHAANPQLICEGPDVKERKSPEYWVIGCHYVWTPSGELPLVEGLDRPTDVTWQDIELSEPIDTDLDLRPILMSNGKPPPQFCSRGVSYKRLTLVKNFPYYDSAIAAAYEMMCNETAVTIGGTLYPIEHVCCVSITPNETYRWTATILPIRFTFDLITPGILGEHPFQHRLLDQGTDGWYSEGGANLMARFSDGRGNLMSDPVRLDGTGKPLASHFADVRVGYDSNLPTANPTPIAPWLHDNSLPNAKFVYYKKTRIGDLSPLFALFTS